MASRKFDDRRVERDQDFAAFSVDKAGAVDFAVDLNGDTVEAPSEVFHVHEAAVVDGIAVKIAECDVVSLVAQKAVVGDAIVFFAAGTSDFFELDMVFVGVGLDSGGLACSACRSCRLVSCLISCCLVSRFISRGLVSCLTGSLICCGLICRFISCLIGCCCVGCLFIFLCLVCRGLRGAARGSAAGRESCCHAKAKRQKNSCFSSCHSNLPIM